MVAEVLTLTLVAVVAGVGVFFMLFHLIVSAGEYRREMKKIERVRRGLE